MEDKTLYVVSGFMRTGTSMMMKALEAGGLDSEYKQSRDEMKERFADEHYNPNIGGLYELEKVDYLQPTFPQKYKGKLIKGLNRCVSNMAVMPDGIRVIFMMRDPEEIRQSYEAFFGQSLSNITNYERNMKIYINQIKNRKDVLSIHVFRYRDVINNPLKYFKILEKTGWKINSERCVQVIDEKYCRFKKEILTKGI